MREGGYFPGRLWPFPAFVGCRASAFLLAPGVTPRRVHRPLCLSFFSRVGGVWAQAPLLQSFITHRFLGWNRAPCPCFLGTLAHFYGVGSPTRVALVGKFLLSPQPLPLVGCPSYPILILSYVLGSCLWTSGRVRTPERLMKASTTLTSQGKNTVVQRGL